MPPAAKKNAMKKQSPAAKKKTAKKSSAAGNTKGKKNNANAKKSKKNRIEDHLNRVEAALIFGYGCPRHPVLEKMLRPCLAVCDSGRQPLQKKGVEMLSAQVHHISNVLTKKYHEKRDFIHNAPLIQADIVKTADHLAQQLHNLNDQHDGLKARLNQEESFEQDAKQAVQDANKFREDVFNATPILSKQLQQVREVEKNQFQKMLDHPPQGAKFQKEMKQISNLFEKVVELDEAVLVALPAALQKLPANRGPFDDMTLQETKKQLRNWILDTEFKIGNQSNRELDADAKVKHAEDELQQCKANTQTARELLQTVDDNLKRNKEETKENEKRRKTHPKNVESAEIERQEAEKDVHKFADVLASFEFLKNRATTDGSDALMLGDREGLLELEDSPMGDEDDDDDEDDEDEDDEL
ncbi:unnamed protein product [Amoebophrya sp. A120]|nr:unnamed protein product [Amoebophrya sp. A120]|eukprot:GSA120T00003636001.1